MVRIGEIYGKQKADGSWVMYGVVGCGKGLLTLQNLEPHSAPFDTTAAKLEQGGYQLVSQRPFVAVGEKRLCRGRQRKPSRCPYTVDFLEGRADSEKPLPG